MMNLTFGEQVKIILGRRGMTIKDLAEIIEKHTGRPMSRQNLTQKLGRDNFQEQDMRLIAEVLECKLTLSITDETQEFAVSAPVEVPEEEPSEEFVEEPQMEEPIQEAPKVAMSARGYLRPSVKKEAEVAAGEMNPYTRKEYESNSVRVHPTKIGYIQVYSREQHKWNDMTEWAFLANEERRKKTLGKNYRPPIYLD